MISRLRVIGLIGAGAISSAGICSLYIAYTLQPPSAEPLPFIGPMPLAEEFDPTFDEILEQARYPAHPPNPKEDGEQSFLVAFLANADPQVRTLAAWGLMSDGEGGQSDILDFVRYEKDPEVRASLFRYLQGQRSVRCCAVADLVRQEKDKETWLAGCDLLAGVVQNGAVAETVDYFNQTVVPELKHSAVHEADLHMRIGAIIALRRAKTPEAVEALREIVDTSNDVQVVQAASSAVRYTIAAEK